MNGLQTEDKVNIKKLKMSVAAVAILAMTAVSGFARDKYETIDAQAYGTSTQLGKNFTVRLIIYEYSTPEDRKILIDSFQKGQNDGLVNALEKMKAVGRITMPNTLGFDVSYIHEIKTPTGRSIRFITNRKIAFGEAYWNSQSKSFNLTAGEINIDDQDKKKSGRRPLSGDPAHDQQGWRAAVGSENEPLEAQQRHRLAGRR